MILHSISLLIIANKSVESVRERKKYFLLLSVMMNSSCSSFGICNNYCNGIRRTAVVCNTNSNYNNKKSRSLSVLTSVLLFLTQYCILYITIITIVTTSSSSTTVVGGVTAAMNSNDYLYLNDASATSVGIIDITSVTDTSYVLSNQPRIIEFYSPYCVRFVNIYMIDYI